MGACFHVDTVTCDNCRPRRNNLGPVQTQNAWDNDYILQLQRAGIVQQPSPTDRRLGAIEKQLARIIELLERRGNAYDHFPLSGETCHCGGRAVKANLEDKAKADGAVWRLQEHCAWCLAEAAHAAGLTVIGPG